MNVAHAATICIYEYLRWQRNPPILLAILWGGAFKLDFCLPPVWKIVHFDLYILSTGDVKNMLARPIPGPSFGWLI